jgi:hypothetical protein
MQIIPQAALNTSVCCFPVHNKGHRKSMHGLLRLQAIRATFSAKISEIIKVKIMPGIQSQIRSSLARQSCPDKRLQLRHFPVLRNIPVAYGSV